jgi:hypothetical protein
MSIKRWRDQFKLLVIIMYRRVGTDEINPSAERKKKKKTQHHGLQRYYYTRPTGEFLARTHTALDLYMPAELARRRVDINIYVKG